MSSISLGNPQWICFINGLEVPILQASTSSLSNQLTTAQITMPFTPFLSKIPKNTKITLFSLDLSKQEEPKLEFDGIVQAISWRKDKLNGNTALFVMAQTDGIVWSERKKFNFYLENAFGISQLLKTTQELTSLNTITANAVSDPLSHILTSNNYDAGEVTAIFLTHMFDIDQTTKKFSGKINFTDCGYSLQKSNKVIDDAGVPNLKIFGPYLKRFYTDYQVTRKLCRVPIPDKWKEAFQVKKNWEILTRTLTPLEGEVNYWNYVSYICDHFNFEIYDIPDCNYLTSVSKENMSHINKRANTNGSSILAEYLIKPKSMFGPIPYCNVIFPDQVLDKSYFKNFQNEITRCWTTVLARPFNASGPQMGVVHQGITGPHFTEPNADSYFVSFNVKDPIFEASDVNRFLLRNAYEEEFGVTSRQVQISELLARLFTSQATAKNTATLQEMVNHEFFTSYVNRIQFTIQVTPDVDVIPGMSILILDENDDHTLAYCFGREKIWDKNGQSTINLKITSARHYSMEVGFSNNYMNTFDPHYYEKTYKDDVRILEDFIGCKTIDQTVDIKTTIFSLMKSWNETYQQNTSALKQKKDYKRSRTSYSNYLEFYNVSTLVKYDPLNAYNKMPDQLILKWDISEQAASMNALQYTYAENGYKNPQSTDSRNPFLPTYNDLNTPGPIQVSTYISGIVNCHNRYLMQIGNSIT